MTPADLKRWMRRRGLTQAQAAALIGVTQQAVSKWLRGGPVPAMPARIIDLLDRLDACEGRAAGEPEPREGL